MKTLVLFLCIAICSSAFGREVIDDYAVFITVEADGTLAITERIEVQAAQQQIKRGIYRDFIVRSRGPLGIPQQHAIDLRSVTRNGEAEPHHWRGARLFIGEAQTTIPSGKQVYEMHYRTAGWLDFSSRGDRLYWNVTGNDWVFPIKRARVEITIPGSPPREALTVEAWTGATGSTAQGWGEEGYFRGLLVLGTTRPLAPREGFTVAVTWPQGAIAPRSQVGLAQALAAHTPSIVALITLAMAAVFYVLLWWFLGRNPPAGRIRRAQRLPPGLSPSLVRWLYRQRWDGICMVAAMVELESRGLITFENDDAEAAAPQWGLTRIAETLPNDLSPESAVFMQRLLPNYGDHIALDKRFRHLLRDTRKRFKKTLRQRLAGRLLADRRYWSALGLVFPVTLAVITINQSLAMETLFFVLMLSIFSALAGGIVQQAIEAVHDLAHLEGKLRTAGMVAIGIATAFIGSILLAIVIAAGWALAGGQGPLVAIGLAAQFAAVVAMAPLLRTLTPTGRRALDMIEGYRAYLENDLPEQIMQDPRRGEALYVYHLPWAIALNLENQWRKSLGDAVAGALADDQGGQRYDWYNRHLSRMHNRSISSTIGAAMSSSMGGSGSGGSSGSSGGGGGGGGGGGW